MFKTKNDLEEETRAKVAELLNARLADCIDLQTQTKQAHWNVKGPTFIALHELFDKVNEAVEDYVVVRPHVDYFDSRRLCFARGLCPSVSPFSSSGNTVTATSSTPARPPRGRPTARKRPPARARL